MSKWGKVIIYWVLIMAPVLAMSQKTDTVYFYNGDRTICEIKNLTRGKLLINTVAMGTISVEWRKVKRILSPQTFEIVISDHTTFYGQIKDVDSLSNAKIKFGIFEQVIPLQDIVMLNPIRSTFWTRLDGSLSIGASYMNATENLQLNSNGDINLRNNRATHTLSFNSNFSRTPVASSEKQDAGYRYQLFHKKRIYNAVNINWERNTELGIQDRVISGLTIGYNPIENYFNVLSLEIGGSGNREATTEDSIQYNIEGMVRVKYDLFLFANPKLFITIESNTFPSFNIVKRIRSNIDTKITWEIFEDFTFGISYWGAYDSQPTDNTAHNFDWGTTTSVGYTF
ncbi:MAG: DUF481 domain-containing protein [Bacteroidota bacterium]